MRKGLPPYVVSWRKGGRIYLYFRKTRTVDGKRVERLVRLPDDPDSEEFWTAYWRIRSGQLPKQQSRYTLKQLTEQYLSSPKFRRLKPRTRADYRRIIDMILEKNAQKDVRRITRQHVRRIHAALAETPRKADWVLQVLSILFSHAQKELDWIKENPASGIEKYGTQRPMQPWPEWMRAAWIRYCEEHDEELALTIYHLGAGTGQRPGDLVRMRWDHFDGEYMAVVQEKTGERLWVYCPAALRSHLARIPKRGAYILAKNLTEPLSYDAIEGVFRRVRAALGPKARPYTLHGLRYVAAVELAESGASDAEIQAVTGHRTLQMVQKYRARARQKALSKQAQKRRESRTERDRNGS